MANRGMRGDWVDFVALLLLVSGSLDSFQGLIAIVRDNYYTLDPNEIIAFDLTTWGWILLLWGVVVSLTGVALWLRSTAARWFAVVICATNIIGELGFAGGNNFPLWGLTVIALNVLAIYGLIVHWHGATEPA